MTVLRFERFDATSNTAEVIGYFEINDIENDAFRLDAFIMDRIDLDTDMKVLDLDQFSDWLDNSDNLLLIVASGDNVTFVLHKDNNTDAERQQCHGTDNE